MDSNNPICILSLINPTTLMNSNYIKKSCYSVIITIVVFVSIYFDAKICLKQKIIFLISYRIVDFVLMDLSGDEGRFLQLKHAERISIGLNLAGFLPNSDLIVVSL